MLRDYTPRDEDAVISIWREASALAHPFLTPDFMDHAENLIRTVFIPKSKTWVLVHPDNGSPIGFISLMGNAIGGLFLQPIFHGQGYGQAMVNRAVQDHDALSVDVFEANAIGRRFYARYGFVFEKRYFDEDSGQPVLTLTWAKP